MSIVLHIFFVELEEFLLTLSAEISCILHKYNKANSFIILNFKKKIVGAILKIKKTCFVIHDFFLIKHVF